MMYKEKDNQDHIMGELMEIFKQSDLRPVSEDDECKILPVDRGVIIAAFSPEIFPDEQNISMTNTAKNEEK